jgi:hypothetical protein
MPDVRILRLLQHDATNRASDLVHPIVKRHGERSVSAWLLGFDSERWSEAARLGTQREDCPRAKLAFPKRAPRRVEGPDFGLSRLVVQRTISFETAELSDPRRPVSISAGSASAARTGHRAAAAGIARARAGGGLASRRKSRARAHVPALPLSARDHGGRLNRYRWSLGSWTHFPRPLNEKTRRRGTDVAMAEPVTLASESTRIQRESHHEKSPRMTTSASRCTMGSSASKRRTRNSAGPFGKCSSRSGRKP